MICYTVIYNNYDILKPAEKNPGWYYIVFSDNIQNAKPWHNIISVPDIEINKYCRKIWQQPEKYFKTDISLFIGGNVEINCNLNSLLPYLDGYDIAIMRHWFNENVNQEADDILKNNQAKSYEVKSIMDIIKEEKFPLEFGLFYGGIILRRDNEKIRIFNKQLSELTQRYCHREQLIYPYLFWKMPEIKVNIMPNLLDLGMFKYHKHESC